MSARRIAVGQHLSRGSSTDCEVFEGALLGTATMASRGGNICSAILCDRTNVYDLDGDHSLRLDTHDQ